MPIYNIKRKATMNGHAGWRGLSAFLTVVFSFCFIVPPSFAAQAGKKAVTKEISGRVSAKTPYYIAIAYDESSDPAKGYEVLIPIEGNISVSHAKSLDQIKEGDTVSVQYDEETRPTPDGEKVFRKAKGLSFVKSAVADVESGVLGAD